MKRRLSFFTFFVSALWLVSPIPAQENSEPSTLWEAASSGDTMALERVLDAGADINEPNPDGLTPLHLAALYGHPEAVRLLCQKEADIEAGTSDGMTALDIAATNADLAVADVLLEFNAEADVPEISIHDAVEVDDLLAVKLHAYAGSNLEKIDKDGMTALSHAAQHDRVEIVQFLIQMDADLATDDFAGRTPLDWAIISNSETIEALLREQEAPSGADDSIFAAIQVANVEAVKNHLAAGLDINDPAYTSKTPLHYAAHSPSLEILKLLLDSGAELETATDEGVTSLAYAVGFGELENTLALLEEGANPKVKGISLPVLFHEAAWYGDQQIAEALLSTGVDPNEKDEFGRAAFHYAALNGYLEIVELLLAHDADPGVATNNGYTPLLAASMEGHLEIVKLLLEKGVDPSIKDSLGQTPVQGAAFYGHAELLQVLLEAGADPHATNTNGTTPLHYASYNRQLEAARLLLENNADPNVKDNYGATSVHLAAMGGDLEVMKLVVENGGDTSLPFDKGRNLLHLAAANGHAEVTAWLLLEKGFAPNATEEDGNTAAHYAAGEGWHVVFQALLLAGAEMNPLNSDNQTPMDMALLAARPGMLLFLLEQTRISIVPGKGTTALILSVTAPYETNEEFGDPVFSLEFSGDLRDWKPLAEVSVNDGKGTFNYSYNPNKPGKFFRVVIDFE